VEVEVQVQVEAEVQKGGWMGDHETPGECAGTLNGFTVQNVTVK